MSVRHLLRGPHGPVTREDLGYYVSGMDGLFVLKRKDLSLWTLARTMWRDMGAYVLAGGPQTFFNLVNKNIGLERIACPRTPPKRETLSVNYLGVAKVRCRYGSLTLEDCVTAAKNTVLGPSLNVWGLSICGRLCVWLGVSDVPIEFAEQYWQAVMKHLRAAMEVRPS